MATIVVTVGVRRYITLDYAHFHVGTSSITKLTIQPEDASAGPVYIPLSPSELQHSNLCADYATPARAGRQPALVYTNQQLPKMSFDLLVADKLVEGQPNA